MTGQASPGVVLTPNRNVTAIAGVGGDRWGANGGDINPVGGGVTGQTGWDERVAPAQSNGQTAANYEQNPIPIKAKGAPTQSVLTQQAAAQLLGTAKDSALLAGGSNQG